MPRLIALATVILIAVLLVLYLSGADQVIRSWALDGQREAQNSMARGLRALRAGEGAALGGFLAVCFGYGFFHAVGPGHGKLLIGGYGAAARVGAMKLSLVALISSLAQGVTAIALVGAGLWLWNWGREEVTGLAEDLFAPLSFGAIALIGIWLVIRGLRGLRPQPAMVAHDHGHGHAHHHHDHDHGHHHNHDDPHHDHGQDGAVCSTCGHAHAPDAAALAEARNWRDVAALIGAVAIRPCTGALFVLLLTAQMGIFWVGVAGTLSMALGTAAVTIATAIAAVSLRKGALAGLAESGTVARVQPVLEITIGALVAVIAGQFALALL